MKHLTENELSAHLDRALTGGDRAGVDAHLRTCAVCQMTLETLVEQDKALRPHLTREPGESHFEELASRIEERIRVTGARPTPVEREGVSKWWHWLRTPVGVSWAGAAAVVVVGAVTVTMTVHELTRTPTTGALTKPAAEVKPIAALPAPDSSLAAETAEPASSLLAAQESAPEPASAAEGGALASNEGAADQRAEREHAVEMKRGPGGEDSPVAPESFAITPPPAVEPSPAASAKTVTVGSRKRRAEPAAGAPAAQSRADAITDTRDKVAARAPGGAARSQPPAPAAASALGATRTDEQGATQRCGTVRDASGKPVASAMLMVVETGVSAQSGADGSFCVDLASSGHTVVVMAVGFQAMRLSLQNAAPGPLALTLQPVSALGGNLAARPLPPGTAAPGASRWMTRKSGESPPGAALVPQGPVPAGTVPADGGGDAFESLPDTALLQLARRARNLENAAARTENPSGYDLAALQWERVLRGTDGGPLESETRFRIAWARYQAWRTAPTHERSVAAIETISSFVLRAPPGPRMDQATRWLGQLRWGETKGTFR